MTKLYNHMFIMAFSMTTPKSCEGDDYPTDLEFHEAIAKRLRDIDRDGWDQCIGMPDDTYIEDEGDDHE